MTGLVEIVRQNPKLAAYVAVMAPLLTLVLLKPKTGAHWFARLEARLAALAGRRRTVVFLMFLTGLAGSTLAGLVAGVPAPRGHDEFSYALAGDTFASGRVTNPPHPMWIHFESFHIIQQPTYMSKYPPGNGLLLALGQVLTGTQASGLWLGAGLLCAAMTWMLQAWFSPSWALFGGAAAALHFGIYSYWTQTYWGGALACVGGALVLGAARRITDDPRPAGALWLGSGLAILANTRPFEGLALSLPVAAILSVWALRQRRFPLGLLLRRCGAPLLLVLALTGGAMAYYNHRVTGNSLRIPYQVYASTYDTISAIGRKVDAGRVYRNSSMQAYYGGWVEASKRQETGWMRLWRDVRYRAEVIWDYYIGPVFTLPLLLSPAAAGQPWIAVAWAAMAFFLAFLTLSTWMTAQYIAPATGLIWILMLAGAQRLKGLKWRGRPLGLLYLRAIPAALLVLLAFRVAQPRLFPRIQWIDHKMRIQRALEASGQRHLVVVRYGPRHSNSREWVYNRADIDGAPVVWAHDLGPEENARLLAYMKGRKAWLLEADARVPELRPFPDVTETARK